ncbi:helix-turn-helix domain-containing protein [Leifsonia sp. AG29]|uniref:helix-turn-helix domain-containing protein n=1 Tax=Leifsonia sp. AG29 TaxID=2598860 RepID=UPI00131A9129|nr:helix-turn-helix transcriptional regulator [Leifsonia sp. AG29]
MPRAKRQPTIYAEQTAVRRLAEEREAQGISVRRLAELLSEEGCPMHASAVSDTLNGSRRLSVDELVAFARVLQVPLAQLVEPKAYAQEEIARLQNRAEYATAAWEFAQEFSAKADADYRRAVLALDSYWRQHPEGRPQGDPEGQIRRGSRAIDRHKDRLRDAVKNAERLSLE